MRLPHKMTPATQTYQREVKDRARRSRQIICFELPDGTYWGCTQYGQCLYAKNADVCVSNLVTKANKWLKAHPKEAMAVLAGDVASMLRE